ncbi:MAG: phosphotriesterase-related protein, partial [Pseudomonadota bacterium]
GMDRFGQDELLSMEARIKTVVDLCGRGYADRMVLSHDAICSTHWALDRNNPDAFSDERFHLITNIVVPALVEAGVSESQIDQMLIQNPARILSGEALT